MAESDDDLPPPILFDPAKVAAQLAEMLRGQLPAITGEPNGNP